MVIWTGERARQQRLLVTGMYQAAAGVPRERRAAIAGGLPGADKAAELDRAGLDRSRYLTVSIDGVLDRMAGAGLIPAAGRHERSSHERSDHEGSSHEGSSHEGRGQEANGSSPLARAALVHAEAQYLAKRVLLRALVDGRNLILDISLASWRAAEAWTYALRFADYEMTAVFAAIGVDEAVREAEKARRRGEEEFRRGRGYGGRVIPAAAIRALASPIAAATGNRIRWAVGARSAGAIGGTVGSGTFPGSAVITLLISYREGRISLDDLSLEFRARRWPRIPGVCPPELEPAREAIDDPEPYVPGSFDDVVLAYDLGWLSAADFDILAVAAG
ncbi:MAG TPA: hypothetical protein VFV73_09960 [Streptosporangiaceae bacterium]|nr:hypothetical protein [Streptosporangiaceae bacterium]